MVAITIHRKCERCNGLGEIVKGLVGDGTEIVECPDCEGSGRMIHLWSEDLDTRLSNILDKCNDVLDKCNDIFEKVNI